MVSPSKIRILITNDDGYKSLNLRSLAQELSSIAEVFVFAPETEQSGVGQAFTVRTGLKVQKIEGEFPYEMYSVAGTPADAVKFALGHFSIANNLPFDLCFSGINVGENAGVSALYSGTVGGAREAALWNVPAIALSLQGVKGELLTEAIDFAKEMAVQKIYKEIPQGVFWNVNFPKRSDDFKGYKSTAMSLGMFTDHYEKRGEEWFLEGEKLWQKEPKNSDDFLLHQGYATITPHRIDQTDFNSLKKIEDLITNFKRG